MVRFAVEHFLALLDESFAGDGAHSLLGNIRDLRGDDWEWRPRGGERTVREIFEHAAIAKHLNAEHLFGAAERVYADVHNASPLRARPGDTEALLAWAREGHAAFVAGMAALRDADLDAPTRRWHGAMHTNAFAIGATIQHDCYHAGEINHLRALRLGDDAWSPGLERK